MTARRSCVACREETDRADLVRLVVGPDAALWVDYRARLPGRGAWVHPRAECVDAVVRKAGRLAHALRHPGLDASRLRALLKAAIERATEDGLSQAAAGGALVTGHDALVRALGSKDVGAVAIASNAAERTVRGLKKAAGDEVEFTVLHLDREALGTRVGRAPLAAIGARPGGPATHLERQLRRLRDLG